MSRVFCLLTDNADAVKAALRHNRFMQNDAAYQGEKQSLFAQLLRAPSIVTGKVFAKAFGTEQEVKARSNHSSYVNFITPDCTIRILCKNGRLWEVTVRGYESPMYAHGMLTAIYEKAPDTRVKLMSECETRMDDMFILRAIQYLQGVPVAA